MKSAAALLIISCLAVPALAQGRGNGKGKAGSPGASNGHGHDPVPPSSSTLAVAAPLASPSGATPFAWIDDATLLNPGTAWVGVSIRHWMGSGLGETDVPVIDAAAGLSPRLQLGVDVPHVIASDALGTAGGLGTTYFNAKVSVYRHGSFSVAAGPTLELLSSNVADATGQSRAGWGLPASVEYGFTPSTRMYAGVGYFSRGAWFLGGGFSSWLTTKVAASLTFSHAWNAPGDPLVATLHRSDLTGGASYSLTPALGLFGSVSRTIMTSPEAGAGTTVSGGLSVTMSKPAR